MTSVLFADHDTVSIGGNQVEQVKGVARRSPLRRARICLHQDHTARVQEMVIALCHDTYVRPHRHRDKSESYHVIDGDLLILSFDGAGRLTDRVRLGAGPACDALIYRQAGDRWHTVVALSDITVIHETTTGPFITGETEYPSWAPEPTDVESARSFMRELRSRAAL